MPTYGWVIITLVSIIIILFGLGVYITLLIIRPNRRSLLETSILEEEKFPGLMEFYKNSLDKMYKIQSRFGYDLVVYHLKNEAETNKYLIMSHGYTYTHHGCLKYARMMMKYGYNIVLYDQRYHGASGGNFTTLGHYEKFDLHDLITDTFQRYGNDIELGTYGESMGSATVLLEAEMDERVQYVFSDCGFSSLETLVKEIAHKHYPKFLRIFLFLNKPMFKIFTKISISRISPISALLSIKVPVFFAHGKADGFIPYHHTLDMFNSYIGPKQLFIAENDATHANSYYKNTDGYELAIKEFIEKYLSKNS